MSENRAQKGEAKGYIRKILGVKSVTLLKRTVSSLCRFAEDNDDGC